MYNTFADIHKIKYQLVNSILGELEEILKPDIYIQQTIGSTMHTMFLQQKTTTVVQNG